MSHTFLACFAAVALLLTPAPLAAQEIDPLYQAIDTYDAAALAGFEHTETGDRAAVARGARAAIERRDDLAFANLRAAAESETLAPDLRRVAWLITSDLNLRHGRFDDARAAIEAARVIAGQSDPTAFVEDTETNLAFARALAGVPAMTAEVVASETRVERDLAQLARADTTINGQQQEAVLDTGAGYSTIVDSVAERLGLRRLPARVQVNSSTGYVEAGLAVADTLTLAGGQFHNVVFIVLPDEALTFAAVYKIEAIIGFPVLLQLGRLEFVHDDNEVLRHRPSPYQHDASSNLQLDGLQPVAILHAAGHDVLMRMLIDTGARTTHLTQRAIDEMPALAANASRETSRIGGAGGVVTSEDTLTLPSLTLDVGGRPVALSGISVFADPDGDQRYGLIGQDILRSGAGYVIDFDAMRFEVLPPA